MFPTENLLSRRQLPLLHMLWSRADDTKSSATPSSELLPFAYWLGSFFFKSKSLLRSLAACISDEMKLGVSMLLAKGLWPESRLEGPPTMPWFYFILLYSAVGFTKPSPLGSNISWFSGISTF